jgi:phosphatidylserine/phosphatidylglycerophosphate/cardiolipin synthase-like enzyme
VSVRRTVAIVVLLSVAMAVGAGIAVGDPTGERTTDDPSNATLASAYPNPVADEDRGEFVVIRFGKPTNTTGWTLTDGKTTARFPNRTLDGTVAVAVRPKPARNHTEHPVVPLSGRLQLANSGDRLELRSDGATVSNGRYRNAPEGERWVFETGAWEPVGATDYEPVRTDGGPVTAYVLPDAPDVTVETLETADERILVGGYTFTSERIAETLLEAAAEGVEVSVLLDGAPVGGMSDRQARTLDRLTDGGVDVRVLAGPYTRYRFHHPKYAVVDDRAIVTTENFKPAGIGGKSSRGWGVVLENDRAAAALVSLHEADRTWRAATAWDAYREGRTFTEAEPAVGGYGAEHAPKRLDVEAATVLVAPDNAADALVERFEAAEDRILVQQVRIGSRENRLLGAVLDAAARGVRVRIHLGGSWYVEEDNAELVEWLNRRSEAEGWDLEARVDDADGYEKIHTKGVVVDEAAIVGSLNWDRSAQRNNREVLVALDGPGAASYYAGVFEDDWVGGRNGRVLPAGLLAAVAAGGAGTLLLARRIEFVGRKGDGVERDWRS